MRGEIVPKDIALVCTRLQVFRGVPSPIMFAEQGLASRWRTGRTGMGEAGTARVIAAPGR